MPFRRPPLLPVSGGSGGFSNDPADVLIREMIRTGRTTTADAISEIVRHMRSAPYDPLESAVPRWLQLVLDQKGLLIGERADELSVHHAKHVLWQEQWQIGTTPTDYLADAHAVIETPDAWIAAYLRGRRKSRVCIVAQTADVVPSFRQGPHAGPWKIVIYSADTARIVTAYMVASLARIRVTGDVVWLR